MQQRIKGKQASASRNFYTKKTGNVRGEGFSIRFISTLLNEAFLQ